MTEILFDRLCLLVGFLLGSVCGWNLRAVWFNKESK